MRKGETVILCENCQEEKYEKYIKGEYVLCCIHESRCDKCNYHNSVYSENSDYMELISKNYKPIKNDKDFIVCCASCSDNCNKILGGNISDIVFHHKNNYKKLTGMSGRVNVKDAYVDGVMCDICGSKMMSGYVDIFIIGDISVKYELEPYSNYYSYRDLKIFNMVSYIIRKRCHRKYKIYKTSDILNKLTGLENKVNKIVNFIKNGGKWNEMPEYLELNLKTKEEEKKDRLEELYKIIGEKINCLTIKGKSDKVIELFKLLKLKDPKKIEEKLGFVGKEKK